jgi:hypothetical protein
MLSRHLSEEHHDSRQALQSEIDELFDDVYLQTWTHCAHGAEQQYWVVKKDNSLIRPVPDQDVFAHLQLLHKREHKRLESEKQGHVYCQDTGP